MMALIVLLKVPVTGGPGPNPKAGEPFFEGFSTEGILKGSWDLVSRVIIRVTIPITPTYNLTY